MADPKLYRLVAEPDLLTLTPGAKVTYRCRQTYDTLSATGGKRDAFQWYCYNDREKARELGKPVIVRGPASPIWKDAKWAFPGRHTVSCLVTFTDGDKFYYSHPQWVETVQAVMAQQLERARQATDPVVALSSIIRYIKVLKDIEAKQPLYGSPKKDHDVLVAGYEAYRDKLRELLLTVMGETRYPLRAVHLEPESQRQSQLNVFLVRQSEGGTGEGREKWMLVDWTNPVVRERTGVYEATGATAEEAIRRVIKDWDAGNRYYNGVLSYELPSPPPGVGAISGQFETDGKSSWDSVATFFEWVGLGAAVVAGVVTLIAPIPGSQLVSAAIWTAIFSSTAAAVINVGQRHEEGFGSWKDDAFDGLTIVGNLFAGAGTWVKGATVLARNAQGQVMKSVLLGQVGTDSVQGVLLAAEHIGRYDEIMQDTSLTPDARAKKLLELFRSAAIAGTMTYVSLKGSKTDLANLNERPKYLSGPEAKTPKEKLKELEGKPEPVKGPGDAADGTPKTGEPPQHPDGEAAPAVGRSARPAARPKLEEMDPPAFGEGLQLSHEPSDEELARASHVWGKKRPLTAEEATEVNQLYGFTDQAGKPVVKPDMSVVRSAEELGRAEIANVPGTGQVHRPVPFREGDTFNREVTLIKRAAKFDEAGAPTDWISEVRVGSPLATGDLKLGVHDKWIAHTHPPTGNVASVADQRELGRIRQRAIDDETGGSLLTGGKNDGLQRTSRFVETDVHGNVVKVSKFSPDGGKWDRWGDPTQPEPSVKEWLKGTAEGTMPNPKLPADEKIVDLTGPVKVEGHTKNGGQKTVVQEGHPRAHPEGDQPLELPIEPRPVYKWRQLGDLRYWEVLRAQAVANVQNTVVFVVGSAAKGKRRGLDTKLPFKRGWSDINKYKETRSDIDYIVPNEIGDYADKWLREIDGGGAIRMEAGEYVNLGSSPAILFRPHGEPVTLSQQGDRRTGPKIFFTGKKGMEAVHCDDPAIQALIEKP